MMNMADLSVEALDTALRLRFSFLEMLASSFQVRTRTSTRADIQLRRKSVLETYIQLFIDEAERIFREGPVKKYRNNRENQLCMKGKL